MKILLIQSYLEGSERPIFPIGIACLLPYLKDHDVRFFDTNIYARPFAELEKLLKDFSPDVAGISLRNIDSTNKREVVFYYKHLRTTLEIIKMSKGVKTVIGGPGFSIFARDVMDREKDIDFGVFLEGEETFPELLKNMETPGKVAGIFYRENGKVNFTGQRDPVDMDKTCLPDREQISLNPYMEVPWGIGVETKRGCLLECIYCVYGYLNGKRLRFRNPERIVDEIEYLVTEKAVKRFTFVDSVFNVPLKHAEDICHELVKRQLGVTWSAWFNEREVTREFISLVKEAGCTTIIFSPDGFSDVTLAKLGKEIKKEDILRTFDYLRDSNGVEVCYNFFKNPPGQTFRTVLDLASFYLKAKRTLGKRNVHFEFNSIRIEPHTKLYNLALKEKVISKGEDLLYPRYYTNPDTHYLDKMFDLFLWMKGK